MANRKIVKSASPPGIEHYACAAIESVSTNVQILYDAFYIHNMYRSRNAQLRYLTLLLFKRGANFI